MISNDNPVVLYSSGHLARGLGSFCVMRHNNMRVLNGSLQAAVCRITNEKWRAYPPAARDPCPIICHTEEVAEGMDGAVCTINALPAPVYDGSGDFYYGRKGHIPGSLSLPFSDLLRDEFPSGRRIAKIIVSAEHAE